ncbi:hypothetical protein [Streptomyces xiamenensis]|uniref:hypothetical protein n=1 Tax=Streptomyces xiamenensis TaxID=408015 RepID=UPI003D70A33D
MAARLKAALRSFVAFLGDGFMWSGQLWTGVPCVPTPAAAPEPDPTSPPDPATAPGGADEHPGAPPGAPLSSAEHAAWAALLERLR